QPSLHVGVERLPIGQRAVPAEDRVGAGRRELPALLRIAGLEDDRPSLRAARHVELPADLKESISMLKTPWRAPAGGSACQERAGGLVRDNLVTMPGVEQLPGRPQEGPGSLVPVLLGEEAAAPE